MEFHSRQDAVAEQRREQTRTTQFSFIRFNAQGDSSTPSSISQIRSHVARDIHARARQKRIDNLRIRSLPPRPSGILQPHSACAAGGVTRTCGHGPQSELVERAPLKAEDRVVVPNLLLQYPVGTGQVFARDITQMERYMLSTFMNYTENYKNAMQRTIKHRSVSAKDLRRRWIPYCMNQEGLLETLFLKAGNALSEITGNREERWDLVACHYRERCLKKAIEALARENMCPSDNTIALVISVGADDFIMGNIDGWLLHGRAALEMVKKRGGLPALMECLDSLLASMVAWSIFNPSFKLVEGPEPDVLLQHAQRQNADRTL